MRRSFWSTRTKSKATRTRFPSASTQLGGDPDLDPATLTTRSHSEYVEGDDLVSMIKENLVAERIAIESYTEIIRFLGDKDVTSRRLMEEISAAKKSMPTTCWT